MSQFPVLLSLMVVFTAAILMAGVNHLSFLTVRYYLLADNPELSSRVVSLIWVNRVLHVTIVTFAVISVVVSGSINNAVAVFCMVVPIVALSSFIFRLFTKLHKHPSKPD
jgi:hypothetical protein